ncbi:hypothetical protein RND81_02G055100 [Saponaria officinalis]|uniref:DUF7734 domain-containing protein n=1 Tax=Saponaria officinalis TaxID=3572 RepID=A0AAW1MQ77_SAPOF
MLLNYSYKLWPTLHFSPPKTTNVHNYNSNLKLFSRFESNILIPTKCKARRRVRIETEDENEEDEGFGYNEEIGMLELYSQSARGEALLVTALVDGQEVEVIIFKGFSSCLSYQTSPDPWKSVLPQRAEIKCIDRVRGPFDPDNIHYIEKGLTLHTFISRFNIPTNVE